MCAEVLTLGQMARRLGVTQKWLKAQADAGNVPCLKAERHYLFEPSAVVDRIAERAAVPTQCAMVGT